MIPWCLCALVVSDTGKYGPPSHQDTKQTPPPLPPWCLCVLVVIENREVWTTKPPSRLRRQSDLGAFVPWW